MPRRPADNTFSISSASVAPAATTFDAPTISAAVASTPVELKVHQGDDKRWLFRFLSTDGSPFSLTGYTAALQFRRDSADVDRVVAASPTVQVTNAPGGEITVTLESEKSRLLTQPTYVWDLEVVETAAAWTTTVLSGILTVTKEITRTET